MFVFLDIGFTLLGGPSVGPARRLVDALKIPETEKSALADTLFRTPFAHSDALTDYLVARFDTHPDATRSTAQKLWHAQTHEARVLPGAADFLCQLKTANIPFGFISNIWAPFYEGFERLFPTESTSCPCFPSFKLHQAKPDLALYQMALDHVGVAPEQVIMIGDTYQMDIAPPRQLGMKTVWILHRPQKELADIIPILNGMRPPPDLTVANIGLLSVEHLPLLLEKSVDA